MTSYDQQYRRVKNVFGSSPEPCLLKYFTNIDNSRAVLDLGAGQGRNSFFLAQNNFRVIALDPSSVATEFLFEQASLSHLPITAVNRSFNSYEAGEAPFSAILIFGLIQILTWSEIKLLLLKTKEWTQPGSLIFITAFSTLDESYQRCKSSCTEMELNSFRKDNGEVRTFLKPGQILNLLNDLDVLHHWEGLGPKHHHGNGHLEQHAMIEGVFRKK